MPRRWRWFNRRRAEEIQFEFFGASGGRMFRSIAVVVKIFPARFKVSSSLVPGGLFQKWLNGRTFGSVRHFVALSFPIFSSTSSFRMPAS
jgi:hypothetical protein